MVLKLISLCLAFQTVALAEEPKNLGKDSDQVKITTFNIKWFGRVDPSSQTPVKDQIAFNKLRAQELRKFLNSEVVTGDIVAFQEIVDTKGLDDLLPPGWTCSTYDHENSNHQHVKVCVGPKLSLKVVPYDDNNLIEEVAFNPERARPAVRIDVYRSNGRKLLRVVAVHLKASPEFSDVREFQVRKIGDDIRQSEADVPVVVLGDFNSYPKDKTARPENDEVIFEKVLRQGNPTLRRVDLKNLNTFRSERSTGQFDQIYFSRGFNLVSSPSVFAVCNSTQDGSGFLNHKFYVTMISDHCPVTVTLSR